MVTLWARITGQGRKGSASCKCSHLISQLTKYYGLAHKNQSAELPGVLNSRSCDQKQAGCGDRSGEVATASQGLPLGPVALRQRLKPSRKLSPCPETHFCLLPLMARAFREVLSLRSRSRAASKKKINAFEPHKSMKISRSGGKNPSSTTWMFEPWFSMI